MLLGRNDTAAYAFIGVAVGAGELEEDTYKELARVKRELEDSRFGLARSRDENQELRARLTWLESQASTVE
jgi:BMFP domain-containing protein YqiC